MLQHVQNFYNKRKKTISNLEKQLELLLEKERRLQHSKEKLKSQIEAAKAELNLSEDEVDSLIREASIANNKQNQSESTQSENNEE